MSAADAVQVVCMGVYLRMCVSESACACVDVVVEGDSCVSASDLPRDRALWQLRGYAERQAAEGRRGATTMGGRERGSCPRECTFVADWC